MPDTTLEALTKRVEEIERQLATQKIDGPVNDWRRFVGTLDDDEFTRSWLEETATIRDADRAQVSG